MHERKNKLIMQMTMWLTDFLIHSPLCLFSVKDSRLISLSLFLRLTSTHFHFRPPENGVVESRVGGAWLIQKRRRVVQSGILDLFNAQTEISHKGRDVASFGPTFLTCKNLQNREKWKVLENRYILWFQSQEVKFDRRKYKSRIMNDAEVSSQIQQMIRFIRQEAEEKANEISVSAEEVPLVSTFSLLLCDISYIFSFFID